MPLVITQKNTFTPMIEGLHPAVFGDVRDLGLVKTQFGEKRQIAARLYDAQGREATRWYGPSLHEKSTLAKDLVILKGEVPPTFDIESLTGTQCQVHITEKLNSKGQKGAKVEKILKPAAGQNVPLPKKAQAAAKPPVTPNDHGLLIDDNDIPF